MLNNKKHVLFIGAGRMAQAIIAGLIKKEGLHITVTNSGNQERLDYVSNRFGVEAVVNWEDAVMTADVIFLASPPSSQELILKELSNFIKKQLVVTVAAGLGTGYLESLLPEGTSTAWVMPNTAAELGGSSTLYTTGQHMTEDQLDLLKVILRAIGEYEEVTEQQVKELTAITGSSPAFVYKFAKALVENACQSGVSEEQARRIVAQMIVGSSAMLSSGENPQELMNQVATPGGSTAEGIKVLEEGNFEGLIMQAIEACRKKASE